MRTVAATRYVLPLREGGSLPAIVEADDGACYVVKFHGAGQGALALVAEVVVGEIARTLGLRVPEIVLVELEEAFGRSEPDPEIRHLLKASVGLNAGLAYLPSSLTFDTAAGDIPSALDASLIVWLDAFAQNVDRTPRNPNLLKWKQQLYCIDHGAALYFHHASGDFTAKAATPFPLIAQHVLLPWATDVAGASWLAHELLQEQIFTAVLQAVPDAWLTVPNAGLNVPDAGLNVPEQDAAQRRRAYVAYLQERLAASAVFEKEVARARKSFL